jgi:hypothetical protein
MNFLRSNSQFRPIKDQALLQALNELSRTVNISATYGSDHTAANKSVEKTAQSLRNLFASRTSFTIGNFNGALTLDGNPVRATGTLLTALERRLAQLRITSLKVSTGITSRELKQLVVLLASKEEVEFNEGFKKAAMSHVKSEHTTLKSVRDDQSVVNNDQLNETSPGVINLEGFAEEAPPPPPADINVNQIVAFIKGDAEFIDSNSHIDEELERAASNPAQLAKLILESVRIRQSSSHLSGESLGDIVLGCLKRTFEVLYDRPKFQTPEGKGELQKSLLLLEENLLNKLSALTQETNPELDRKIAQAIQEMDARLGFEAAAMHYAASQQSMEQERNNMLEYIKTQDKESAEELIKNSGIPHSQWNSIVVGARETQDQGITSGIETLTSVFEKLESVIKTTEPHEKQVKNLLGKANENLDDSIDTTREKLDMLSRQLEIAKAGGTIGGQGRKMDQRELLAALAEVAQELMQPITAITASLEMMLNGFVGEISEEQRDLLGVAANSGEHLKYLMKELIDIVGCPANKGVDDRFHTTSDAVVQMIDAAGQEHLNLGFFK